MLILLEFFSNVIKIASVYCVIFKKIWNFQGNAQNFVSLGGKKLKCDFAQA